MFTPFYDCIEVEPIDAGSVIAGGFDKIEAAKIVSIPSNSIAKSMYDMDIRVGDIIFFRPHGFFDLPEYQGKRRHVVKLAPEFILGVYRE